MRIKVDYTLSFEEWAEAARVSNRPVTTRRGLVLGLIIWASILTVSILVLMMFSSDLSNQLLEDAPGFAIGICGAVLVWFLVQWKLRRQARADWETDATLSSRITVTLDESALSTVQEFGQASWQWRAFKRFDETAKLFVLYLCRRSFLVIPKRAFSEEDLAMFTRFLAATVPPGNRGGFDVISKPLAASSVYVQPLESREFM